MRLMIFCAAGTVIVLVAFFALRRESIHYSELPFEPKTKPIQAAPLCPWREPENDLRLFFPDATRYELEARILSGRRLELAEKLGRPPTADENTLHIYRIYREQAVAGAVLTRRVKGSFGGIELVLSVEPDGRARMVRLQRLRETDAIAQAIENPDWLRAFAGMRADTFGKLGRDIPDVAPEARGAAEAVCDGVRSMLILLATAEQLDSSRPGHHSAP